MADERVSKSPTTRRYSKAQKDQAVRLVEQLREETGEHHGAIVKVARQLGFGVESVRKWVVQTEIDAGGRPGVTTEENAKIRRLEQEVRELRRANADLVGGVVFLRAGARPATAVVIAFIDDHRDRFGVEPICTVLAEHGCKIALMRPGVAWRPRGYVRTPSFASCWTACSVRCVVVQ